MRFRVVFLMAFCSSPTFAAEVIDTFDGSRPDPKIWDECQSYKRQMEVGQYGPDGDKRTALHARVTEQTGNKKTCKPAIGISAAPVVEIDPGPSLVATAAPLGTHEECATGDSDHKQRNELRFWEDGPNRPEWTDPYWYSLTFHVEGIKYHCGSARWVVGQWKQTTGDAESPVFAQRIDNGVFHLSVQDGICRCMIAKASGDPDRFTLFSRSLPQSIDPKDSKNTTPKCIRTDLPDGAPETPCNPEGLTVQSVSEMPPELPDPTKGWVTMTYHVSGGEHGLIDVFANGHFVVRVSGKIGYPVKQNESMGPVKFKIGQYRDRIPGSAALNVDRICMSKDVGVCDPTVTPLPEAQ